MSAHGRDLLANEAINLLGLTRPTGPATSTINLERQQEGPTKRVGLPAGYCEAKWYAAYTNANHEKRVAEQLSIRAVEHLLPLYAAVSRWKDRQVTLQRPLFPGYVFVRMALHDRLRVQQIPGLAHLVGFNGTPAPLREEEIELLRIAFKRPMRIQPHPYLPKGGSVRILCGPMRGLEGVLLRTSKQFRVVLSVRLIASSVAVEVDASDVERIG